MYRLHNLARMESSRCLYLFQGSRVQGWWEDLKKRTTLCLVEKIVSNCPLYIELSLCTHIVRTKSPGSSLTGLADGWRWFSTDGSTPPSATRRSGCPWPGRGGIHTSRSTPPSWGDQQSVGSLISLLHYYFHPTSQLKHYCHPVSCFMNSQWGH